MLLELFLTFFKIGALSFGGGYGMISVVREAVVGKGWLTDEAFLSFIAVSESTPGPLAVNMATFIGSSQAGFWGALLATAGVVLPAFCIILLIASLLQNLLKYAGVQAFLQGVRPCVVGLIFSTGLVMALSTLLEVTRIGEAPVWDWRPLTVFFIVALVDFTYRQWKHKAFSPVGLILISAILGGIFYTF